MVRDPSIVSPSLTGMFIGGGHNKHGTGSRCTLPKQCRPPSPRRRWRCDRSSYKRSLFSRIRVGLAHYLTGPETARRFPSPSRVCVGSNHSGMGKPIVHCESCLSPLVNCQSIHHLVNCQNSCCARGEGALTECEAGEGREWAHIQVGACGHPIEILFS